ncbi:transcriptional regulator [Marivirga tractuosa]|uniref:Transcriptional repressor, CopY family n=1 Tax=Marivirga tractuosa (strain ATCC 23168 / DSM 4126 / NBRC 15989 / NCIMB 1408 / VKM B-1430 / H-43) TaxID=643867 RepID=E4TVF5_MARTH|nr:BlaI/MecI/CopY family transcriptional regulator [Marivirga tractuosa]ADR20087.1 transcriptional repressor, CopY family [Marivirga tractuosa DSM 4126]BDD15476.1 transcriptional regulator [Marivirga tractuosa]
MLVLTRAEEQIMHKLWSLKKAYVKEVLETLPEPKPAYNTVSTIIRILERKGVVGHEKTGKSYLYYPLLKKDEYKKQSLKKLIHGYFEGSFANMASFFAKEENLSTTELDEVMKHLKDQK